MSVSAVGAVLNIAVTLAIVIDPLKVLRKGPWITILSLAIADLITCIGGFFLWARAVFFRNPGVPYNGFVDFIWGVGYSASFLMLTFLTVQIFMVTKYPIKSRCWLSTTRIILLGTGHWLLAILLGFSNIAWVHFQLRECLIIYIAQHGILEIAIIIQVGLHIQVAIEIVKSGRHISANDEITKHKKIGDNSYKKTVIILTLILFFTAFPYFVLKQLEYVARLEHFGRRETGRLFYAIAYYTRPIIMVNFVVNPIIYSLRLPDYRKSLVALIGVRKETEVQENTNEFQLRNRKALEI